MTLKVKLHIWRMERYWKKYGRKDLCTWVHRYLRLHGELLEDSIYQEMYKFNRNKLIEYYKRDVKLKNTDDTEYGELIDVLADIFNKTGSERVNKYEQIVDILYRCWKKKLAMR